MDRIKVAGCDCGKDSLHVCVIEEVPKNLKQFSRTYKPKVVKANQKDIEQLLKLDADVYVLEPTGHYSYIWINALKREGKEVRLVSPRRVRHYCEYKGITNKADRPDAAAIASYTLENLHSDEAFLKVERMRIRDLYLQLNSTTRSKNPVNNRLGQRLSFEFPEIVKHFEDTSREWLDPEPPATYRFLAGESVTGPHSRQREQKLDQTIGLGLTTHTKALAAQLCEFERMEYALEVQMDEELSQPEFEAYHRIFDRFLIPRRIRAAILSRIYPFTDFLRDGRPFKEYVRGSESKRRSGMTKRDRSEGEFKLCLGMGKILYQSGNKTEWKAGGAKYARTALWQYVKIMIVIRRSKGHDFSEIAANLNKTLQQENISPWLNEAMINAIAELTNTTQEVASLRLHYEFQVGKKGDRRISATAGRFCRMLYKALLDEFVVTN
jgi:hypothetical protein